MTLTKSIMLLATIASAICCADNQVIDEETYIHCELPYGKSSAKSPYRLLSFIDYNGAYVDLDDGSSWIMQGTSSQTAVKNWRNSDSVIIYPTFSPYWSGARYYLFNERTRTSAYVELSKGPIAGRSTCIEILQIDPSRRELVVMNGEGQTAVWTVATEDIEIVKTWKPRQAIILAFYENCYAGWFSTYSYIAINVENSKKDYIRISI